MADIYDLYDNYYEEESPNRVMTKGHNTKMVLQNIPNPQLRVKMKSSDYLVLVAITLNQFFLAVFTSFMAIATAFMEPTELSLERIQYMYYFLFCVLNYYYVFDIWTGLMVRNDKENPPRLPGTTSMRTLSTLIGISIIIIMIEFFLITRFLFVTFPFIEQGFNAISIFVIDLKHCSDNRSKVQIRGILFLMCGVFKNDFVHSIDNDLGQISNNY